MTKIVFFNGPPFSGKDTAVGLLGLRRFSFADDLRDRFDRAFGLAKRPEGKEKDLPLPYPFEDVTYRQGLIAFSEKFMKPTFGEDIFGRILLANIQNIEDNYEAGWTGQKIIWTLGISDSGFASEAIPLVQYFGSANCCICQLHRPGHDFSSDSRSYIGHEAIGAAFTYFCENKGTLDDLKSELQFLSPWLATC